MATMITNIAPVLFQHCPKLIHIIVMFSGVFIFLFCGWANIQRHVTTQKKHLPCVIMGNIGQQMATLSLGYHP